jgi:hypothetical protein
MLRDLRVEVMRYLGAKLDDPINAGLLMGTSREVKGSGLLDFSGRGN